MIRERSSLGIADHDGNAINAAFVASSTSLSSESGIREYTLPVDGL